MRLEDTLLVLFDNGSLRPAATLQLRDIANTVARLLGHPVLAASVLHSDKISPSELGGTSAVLAEQAARDFWQRNPDGEVLLVPAFFGPSRAITHYLPGRLNTLIAKDFPKTAARWRMAPSLVDCKNETDTCNTLVVEALAQEARRIIATRDLTSAAKILLTDHGSPERAVTAVREYLGARLRSLLADEIAALGTASMERRDGLRYAFNEPLLAKALRTPPFDQDDVIVLLQFLSPGRHAGEGGDIAAICDTVSRERAVHIARMARLNRFAGTSDEPNPELRIWLSDTIGAAPQIAEAFRLRFAALINK